MKVDFSKLIVLLVILLNFWFTNRCFCAFEKVAAEPAVLIGAWFAWTGGELWLLASIKKKKVAIKREKEKGDI